MKLLLPFLLLFCCMNLAVGQNKQAYKEHRQKGDNHYQSGDYLNAIEAYKIALKNKLGDKYVTEKLKSTEAQVKEYYQQSLTQANQLFEAGNRSGAMVKYQEALRWKPGDSYLSSQIEACNIAPGTTFMRSLGGSSYDEAQAVLHLNDGGFLIAGRSSSKGSSNTDMYVTRLDRDGNQRWEKTYGAGETEEGLDVIETRDGNFIVVGNSDSFSGMSGIKDMWAVKIDGNGKEMWSRTYGSNMTIDEAKSVVMAHDNGYIIAGNSFINGSLNIMLVKINEQGEEVWRKIYGGDNSEEANQIIRTENGYTIVGNTESKGSGKWDIWLLHIDKEGKQLWDRTYGGGDNETGNALVQTSDGGYLIAGSTYSFSKASQDFWLVKTDENGKQQWAKTFGGVAADEAFAITKAGDGDYVAAGFTEIWNAKDRTLSIDGHDIMMVKVSEKGDVRWERSFGGVMEQRAFDMAALNDGGFLLVGLMQSPKSESTDIMVVKTNQLGLVAID